jgi:chromosome segregation ATPase
MIDSDADPLAKFPVTFESESGLFDEIKVLAARVNATYPDDIRYIPVKNRFDEVLSAFMACCRKNQTLLGKIQELNVQAMVNTVKTTAVVKAIREDGETIERYRKQYEEATSVLQRLSTAEARARHLVSKLSTSVSAFSVQVARGEAFSFGESESIASILQDVTNLRRERDKAAEDINAVASKIQRTRDNLGRLNQFITGCKEMAQSFEAQIAELQTRYDLIHTETEEARAGIGTARPLVEANTMKIEENKENAKLLSQRISEGKAKNYDLGKQLFELTGQMRTHHYNLGQKTKLHNKTARSNQAIADAIDKLEMDISRASGECEHVSGILRDLDLEIAQSRASLDSTGEDFAALERLKQTVRSTAKEKRDIAHGLVQVELRQENEGSRMKRQIQKRQRDREGVLVKLGAEKRMTVTVAAHGVDVSMDIRAEKKGLQGDKLKIRNCEKEVEAKHVELTKVLAQTGLVEDDKRSNMEKREEDAVTLAEITRKNEQQTDLIENGRKERNMLKRRYEAALRDQVELRNNVHDLFLRIEELKEQKRKKELAIVDYHFRCQECRTHIAMLEGGVAELGSVVMDANHSISALTGEYQVLSHILGDAAGDRLLQAKEFEAARDARKALSGVLVQRRATVEDLKNTIQTTRMDLHKGSIEYGEKVQLVAERKVQMDALVRRHIELKEKRERLEFYQHEQRRMFGLYVQETEKSSALMYESIVPRNVHRWQMVMAIDPNHAIGLQYMSRIYARIDVAHRTLVSLVSEKEQLKKAIEEQNRRVSVPRVENNAKSMPSYIESYKADLNAKDEALAKLGEELDLVRNAIADVEYNIDLLRGKVNNRRTVVSVLRGRNLASREAKRQEMLYMTEPEGEIPLGGGFVKRLSGEPERQSDIGVTTLQLSVMRAQTPQLAAPGQTPRAAKSGKKILRPQTVQIRRRARTPLGSVIGDF